MSYCSDKGIPHSQFLKWSAEDRAKTIAYMMEHADTCVMCGTAPWEWEDNAHAYGAEEKWCKGCYIKHVASEEGDKLPGTTFTLIPMTPDRIALQYVQNKRRAKMRRDED